MQKVVFTCKTHAHDDLIAVSALYAAASLLLILFPRSKAPSKEELNQLVQEVNQEYLKPEEYLFGHAYYYSKSGQSTGEYFMQNLLPHSPGIIS